MSRFTASTDVFEDRIINTASEISLMLEGVRAGKYEFFILATANEDYVQTVCNESEFRVEGRDGTWDSHKIAVATSPGVPAGDANLSFEDAERVFHSYFQKGASIPGIAWMPSPEPGPLPIYGWIVVLLGIAVSGGILWWAFN